MRRTFSIIKIKIDSTMLITSRNVVKVLDVIGKFGGFNNVMMKIFSTFGTYFSSKFI